MSIRVLSLQPHRLRPPPLKPCFPTRDRNVMCNAWGDSRSGGCELVMVESLITWKVKH